MIEWYWIQMGDDTYYFYQLSPEVFCIEKNTDRKDAVDIVSLLLTYSHADTKKYIELMNKFIEFEKRLYHSIAENKI